MNIKKVNIENYKCFYGKFTLEFNNNVNILVGNNESGKSTILEAVNVALTGILRGGRYLKNNLSQYLFNTHVVAEYLEGIKSGKKPPLPCITIEIFFNDNDVPLFEGNGNSERKKECGVVLKIEFDNDYQSEYNELMTLPDEITTIPIEYYKITWKSFARESVSSRSIPIKSVIIDSTSNRYQNGSDIYISRIINDDLKDQEKVELSQAYRKMKQSFMRESSVKNINESIQSKSKLTEKKLKISVDLSTQNSWETALMTYLDEVPFHQIGTGGEQCIVKTNLALEHHKSQEANLILLEEPESHLSHSKLNMLMKNIIESCVNKQIIITTHSSFIANKLGLENLLLINDQNVTKFSDLTEDTYNFFKKLPGYQTLRIIFCKKAVLVEGDSDELVFQKAYMNANNGKLPIEDGIDVISVKLTFKRFLEIAAKIDKEVAVITDNDGDYDIKIKNKYEAYKNHQYIKIFADKREILKTLEPQFVDANQNYLGSLCEVIQLDHSKYDTAEKITGYMTNNKTTWALRVFESDTEVVYPKYIKDAVEWCNG
ncbi:ATP-dependent endonuclease [Methanogenium cariaci]|uniref:ATP-dependent nuclease n=1 Tax=Methanogenium cariaci TaxID=2197 RepID=UPI0007804135|nr:AAA family ATPase [Methanogenium cariaci]